MTSSDVPSSPAALVSQRVHLEAHKVPSEEIEGSLDCLIIIFPVGLLFT